MFMLISAKTDNNIYYTMGNNNIIYNSNTIKINEHPSSYVASLPYGAYDNIKNNPYRQPGDYIYIM